MIDSYVPIERLPDVFGPARVVVTPYVAGSQSGVLHLAMSFGRAVVSSDVGELGSTVADGETGRVVPAGDVAALAEALERGVADPKIADRRMRSEAGWDRVAAKLELELTGVAG